MNIFVHFHQLTLYIPCIGLANTCSAKKKKKKKTLKELLHVNTSMHALENKWT